MTLCTSILFSQSQFCETALVTQLFGNTAVQGADLVASGRMESELIVWLDRETALPLSPRISGTDSIQAGD